MIEAASWQLPVRALLAFSCRHRALRSPAWLARLYALLLDRSGGREDPARAQILVLSKPGVSEDAETVFGPSGDFALLKAPPGVMKAFALAFLPAELDDNNYVHHAPEIVQSKAEYRAFLRDLLRELTRFRRIDAIVSGNFAYFAEREMQAAAEEIGIPFMVLHKENLKSPGRRDYFEDLYRRRRGRFQGRRIIVYNEFEREVQIAAGIAEPQRITVCGMPRLDRAHAWRRHMIGRSLTTQPTVLFFAFGEKAGLPVLRRKFRRNEIERLSEELEQLSWRQTLKDTVSALVTFARENPGVRVLVKTKAGDRHADPARSLFEAAGGSDVTNLVVMEGGDPLSLLEQAWVVVGMNTTAILEGLAMNKPVLTPDFGEAALPEMRAWNTDFGAAVEKMASPGALRTRMADLCAGAPPRIAELSPVAVELLQRWAGNSDGRAGERVRASIATELCQRAGASAT